MRTSLTCLLMNELKDRVFSMGGRQLSEYGLPQPEAVDNDRLAWDYPREVDYDQGQQQRYVSVQQHAALLTSDQQEVYDCFCSYTS